MKKITVYLFVFFTVVVNAQINFEATDEFGTIERIIFDPLERDKLYASTRGNHIIQSFDKGESWEILYSFPENQAWIKNLKYMEDQHALSFNTEYSYIRQNVYIFDLNTNEIVKEYEVPVPYISHSQQVYSYDIYPTDTDIIIVNQRYKIGIAILGKVYYSNNGGTTWDEIYYTNNHENIFPNIVKFSPVNPDKIYFTRTDGLFISEDTGQNWNLQFPEISLYALEFHPYNPNYILMGTALNIEGEETSSNIEEQNLYRSLDGGDSWEIIPIEWNEDSANLFVSINFNPDNPENILILESNEIVISHDDGQTWEHYVYPMWQMDEYMFGTHASFNPFEPNEVYINADHYPMFSEDGGVTLDFLRVPFYRVTSVFLNHNEADPHLYYTARNGIIHKDLTTNLHHPYHISSHFVGDIYSELVFYANPYVPGQVFSYKIDAEQSYFEISENHGQTFISTYTGVWDVIVDFKIDPNNPHHIWIAFLYGGVKIYDIENPNNIIISEVEVPDLDIVTCLYFEALNPGEMVITDGITVKITSDYGQNWEDRSNGIVLDPMDIIYSIDRNPFNPDHMIITTNIDMYMTVDGGENWEPVYAGKVREAKFSKTTNGNVIASIYSDGPNTAQLLISNDGGYNWTEIPREIIAYANSFSMDYSFGDSSVTVYMSTLDLGLLSYEIDFSILGTPQHPSEISTFKMYPNPAKDIVRFALENEKAKSISIYSSTGKMVLQTVYKESIDISALNSGIYFVKITTDNNHHIVSKLIKN